MAVSKQKGSETAAGDRFKQLENFGRYQTIQYFLICLPLFVISLSVVNYVFVAEDINYRCRVPECDDEDSTADLPTWWPENTDTKCSRPVLDKTKYSSNFTCTNTSFLTKFEPCNEWIYETENSLVAGLDLGCQSWVASLVGSFHNAGMIASMMLTGWVADKIGRKPTVVICSVGSFIGIIKIFLTNYYAYLAVEFLESFLSSGLYTVGVVLLIEIGGESKRVLSGIVFSYATYIAEMVFALLAMWLKYWKYLIMAANGPAILFVLYVFVLRESTRWQMLRGKMREAKETFKSMAKKNKLDISPEDIDNATDEEFRALFNVEVLKEKESIGEIVRSKDMMIRLFVTSVCFFSASFVYCGLVVHSVYLPGNKYSNFALVSVTSFPGDLLAYFTFTKYGRKISLQCGYFATAIAIIAQAYTPASITWLKILLYLLGKFSVVVCFSGVYLYSMELFPTSVRGSLVGCGNTIARVGSMLSPLTPLLSKQMEELPAILFSSTAVLAGILLIFTPETKNLPLFDTIAQVETHKVKKKEDPNA